MASAGSPAQIDAIEQLFVDLKSQSAEVRLLAAGSLKKHVGVLVAA